MYGRLHFLFQIYSFSCEHPAAIISDPAINQYCLQYILQQLCNASASLSEHCKSSRSPVDSSTAHTLPASRLQLADKLEAGNIVKTHSAI